MPDETQKERHAPHVLTTLAGVLIAFLLLAAIYVVYQAAHILFRRMFMRLRCLRSFRIRWKPTEFCCSTKAMWQAAETLDILLPTASAFQRALQWQRCTATLRRLRCACS